MTTKEMLKKAGFIYGVKVYDENENIIDVLAGITFETARTLAGNVNNECEEMYPNCYAVVFKVD